MKTKNNINPFPVTGGDITHLSPLQREAYYTELCNHLGLDPALQPFKILRLHGRQLLYCDHGGVQMLNQLHRICHKIVARETVNGCYVVTAHATAQGYRTTESIGAVSIGRLRNAQLCNAMMQAETKAKHRASLDLLGLGMFDESELFPLPLRGRLQLAGTALPLNPSPLYAGEDDGGLPTSLFLSAAGLKKELSNCHTADEAIQLYYHNRQRIEANAKLKLLFIERMQELERGVAA